MSTEYWFKPKAFGYGCTPINWKGWLATVAFAVACIGLAYFAVRAVVVQGGVLPWLSLIVGMFILIGVFVRISKPRTDGAWRWRWNNKNGRGNSSA